MSYLRSLHIGRRWVLAAATFVILLATIVAPRVSGAIPVVSCTNNTAEHRLDVTVNSSSVTDFLIAVDGGAIIVNGSGCTTTDGTTTVDKIVVKDEVGASMIVTIGIEDRFAPGFSNEPGNSDEIEFVFELGTGEDAVAVDARTSGSNVRAGRDKTAGVFRPEINLNAGERQGIDGDVVLKSGVDQVYLAGDSGEDTLRADGGKGTDKALRMSTIINGKGSADEIVGGDRADTLYGDGEGCEGPCAGRDSIKGGGGDDQIVAGAKSDAASGGPGRDPINAGPGDDKLEGNDGADDLSGDDGDDRLQGGNGTDNCVGGPGDDQVETCETSLDT